MNIGSKPKLADADLATLLSPKNPVRRSQLGAQIEYHDLDISERVLKENLRKRTNHAQMYRHRKVAALIESHKKPRVKIA